MGQMRAKRKGFTMRIKEFFIDCVPPRTTHQSGSQIMVGKYGKRFVGQNARGRATKQELQSLVLPHKPIAPYTDALRIEITYRFPMRKSEKAALKRLPAIPCTKRPDADNLAKGLLDVMQGLFFLDDAQVYNLSITKLYAQRTGIAVKIYAIDENTISHYMK